MAKKPISNVSELITALGGHAAAAEFYGVTRQAIANWVTRGMPPAHHWVTDRHFNRKLSADAFRPARKRIPRGEAA